MDVKEVTLVVRVKVWKKIGQSGNAANKRLKTFAAATTLVEEELDGRKGLYCESEYKDLWTLVKEMIDDGNRIADHLSKEQIFKLAKLMIEALLGQESMFSVSVEEKIE